LSYRYLGNKSRLADWIVGEISQVLGPSGIVADPMCGTASVSAALASSGYSVVAADALRFPVVHASVRLLAKSAPQFNVLGGYENTLEWMRRIVPIEGYFFNEFGEAGSPANGGKSRLYFSAENAAHIDGIRESIRELAKDGGVTTLEHNVLLHHLILSTNAVANISGTYGYFHKGLMKSAQRPLSFEPLTFENTRGDHHVFQGDVEDIASQLVVDAVYLDPPYTKRQYAGNYHILETIALEDEPVAVGAGGLRPWKEQASAFCYKRSAADAFRRTLCQLRTNHVFISYSEDGQVSIDELTSILGEFGRVTIKERPYHRYRSSNRVRDGLVLEYLFHLEVE